MPANLENSAVATGLEKVSFIPIPKKGNAKECSNYHTIALQSCLTLWTVTCQLLCPWDFPGKNTGVSCHLLLQGIFPDQGSNPYFLHWQANSLPVSHQGSLPRSTCTKILSVVIFLSRCIWRRIYFVIMFF